MKKLLLIPLLIIGLFSWGQYTPMTAHGYWYKYVKTDSGFALPFRNLSNGTGVVRPGTVICNTADSLLYYFNGVSFVLVDPGGAATAYVDSVTFNSTSSNLFYWKSGVGYGTQINKIDSLHAYTDSVYSYIAGDSTFVYLTSLATGTVTDITGGYGLTGGTITSSGTFEVDTLTIAYKSWVTAHFANISHTHPTSDIISGTFPISRGGTGLSGIGSVGQELRVAGGGTTLEYFTPSAVDVSDTAAMLLPYLRKIDTTAMLVPYLRSNLAATTYATIPNVALKVNISDTAAMLLPYLKKVDTTAMLVPYLRGNIAAATYQPIITLTTTGSSGAATLVGATLNIPQYSGGGSSFDSLRWFNVLADNAVPDSSTNNYTAFTATVARAKAAGGGVVYIPRGKWGLTQTVIIDTSNIIIKGAGAATQIWANTDFGDVFYARPNITPTTANYFHDVGFYDFSVQSAVPRTSGYAVRTNYTHSATVSGVIIGYIRTAVKNTITPFYNGVSFENESNSVMRNTQVYAWHKGVYFTGTAVGASFRNTNNYDGLITGNCFILGDTTKWHQADSTYGIHIAGGTGGVQVEQSNVSFYSNGVRVDTSGVAVVNSSVFIGHAFASDNSGAAGIHIKDLSILQITGGWIARGGNDNSSTIKDGLYIDPALSTLQTVITGGSFNNNASQALNIGAGKVVITGAQFYSNGGDVNLAAGVTTYSVTGNTFSGSVTNSSTSVTGTVSGNNTTTVPSSTYAKMGIGIKAPTAWIDVVSTAAGVIFPRMNTTQRNAITAHLAEIVFNTDSACYESYNGTTWDNMITTLTAPVNGWTSVGSDIYRNSKVRIGSTSAPSYKLDVITTTAEDGISFSTNQGNGYLFLTNTGTGGKSWAFNTTSGSSSVGQGYLNITNADGTWQTIGHKRQVFYANNAVIMTLDSTGNVAIGTTSAPTARLHLPASTTSYASLRIPSGTAPTSPNHGEVWTDASHLYSRLNGATYQLDQQTIYAIQTLTDGSTITWDASLGDNAKVTLAAAGRTLSITNPVAGHFYTLKIIQDGTGSRTITTWPTNTKWPGGIAISMTATAAAVDIITFFYDGTNYNAVYNNDFK